MLYLELDLHLSTSGALRQLPFDQLPLDRLDQTGILVAMGIIALSGLFIIWIVRDTQLRITRANKESIEKAINAVETTASEVLDIHRNNLNKLANRIEKLAAAIYKKL